MSKYLYNVIVAIGKLINTLLGGSHNETLSSRLGKAQRGDNGKVSKIISTPFAFIVDLLFYPRDGWGHCKASIE